MDDPSSIQRIKVLYEDNHIISVVKPVNLPTQEDDSKDPDMLTLVKEYVREKYNKPGNVYVGLVHRLDRPVGGVMVFAKTSKAASRLSNTIAKRAAAKKYLAVVCGNPPDCGNLECYMQKDATTFTSFTCSENEPGAKHALLYFRTIKRVDGLALIDVTLQTGRHHQIRLQTSDAGFPIYGDHRYNPQFIDDKRTNIALYAYSLTVEHPTKRNYMTFISAPTGGVWDMFTDEIKALCAQTIPVYIDDNIIVLDKQKKISVATADGDEDTLQSRLETAFSYAQPVHRLDATTDGVIVFARNDTAFDELSAAFMRQGDAKVTKIYRCTVVGSVDRKEASLLAYLKKDSQSAKVVVSDKPSDGAKEIETKYRVISSDDVSTDLAVDLVTGRTHQIRAHLAYIGNPIVGDDKYGDREFNRRFKLSSPLLTSMEMSFAFPDGSPLSYLNGKTFRSLSQSVSVAERDNSSI